MRPAPAGEGTCACMRAEPVPGHACMHAPRQALSLQTTGGSVNACMLNPTAGGARVRACMHAELRAASLLGAASVHACRPNRRWGPACMHAYQCMPTLVSTAHKCLHKRLQNCMQRGPQNCPCLPKAVKWPLNRQDWAVLEGFANPSKFWDSSKSRSRGPKCMQLGLRTQAANTQMSADVCGRACLCTRVCAHRSRALHAGKHACML